MALFAITATFAPSIGPTLGGWLTENFGWEYIFYINVPPGLLMIAGLLYGLEKKAPHWELLKSTDYAGIVTLGIGLGCLQVFLEEGHRKDWLESQLIVSLGSVALFSLVLFVILQLSRPNPLIDLGILRNRTSASRAFPASVWAWACTARSTYCRYTWRKSRATTPCRSAR